MKKLLYILAVALIGFQVCLPVESGSSGFSAEETAIVSGQETETKAQRRARFIQLSNLHRNGQALQAQVRRTASGDDALSSFKLAHISDWLKDSFNK